MHAVQFVLFAGMSEVLNPARLMRVETIGHERQPLVVIDDCLMNPEGWRAIAADERYAPIGPYYPGVRAHVARGAAAALRAALVPVVKDAFALDPVPPLVDCFYSIVTTPPATLAPIQRLPHIDGLESNRLAILIYLSGESQGGTAFFRQRSTGYETIDSERFPAFEAALQQGVSEKGLPPAAYIAGDTPLYEKIAQVEARPNRAIIYRSHLLHCAQIPPDAPLSPDPRQGRLTINAFLFGS
jgi:hypothetical protein